MQAFERHGSAATTLEALIRSRADLGTDRRRRRRGAPRMRLGLRRRRLERHSVPRLDFVGAGYSSVTVVGEPTIVSSGAGEMNTDWITKRAKASEPMGWS